MRKTSLLVLALGLAAALPAASEVKICAAVQTYSVLESVKEHAPVKFSVSYGTAEDLEALLADPASKCELLISSDERLPIIQIRSDRAAPTVNSVPLARAPLILWSADPKLLDAKAAAVTKKKLKSLALPRAELTPVGYATSLIVSKKSFPTNYLKNSIYRAEQEYQVYALVEGGNVQAGFLTKPLIMDENGHPRGSYWEIPREDYPDLYYYLTPLNAAEGKNDVADLAAYLKSSPEVAEDFEAAGFASID